MSNNNVFEKLFVFVEQISSNILNIKFAFKTQTFEKIINKKSKDCVFLIDKIKIFANEKKMKTTNDMNNINVEYYYLFNHFVDWILTQWFNNIDCTKKTSINFSKMFC